MYLFYFFCPLTWHYVKGFCSVYDNMTHFTFNNVSFLNVLITSSISYNIDPFITRIFINTIISSSSSIDCSAAFNCFQWCLSIVQHFYLFLRSCFFGLIYLNFIQNTSATFIWPHYFFYFSSKVYRIFLSNRTLLFDIYINSQYLL